ncbi:MAG: DnaJ domain-containing protein [Roseiflexaceae bacterium]|nr:DnaJ domain-containing protein [Roseiflexaceae bacterium]
MSQDYYELLQVHPRAESEAVRAAYERLHRLYDPARLDGAADELIQIARKKLTAIEAAYAVLSDPQQRATYDQSLAAAKTGTPASAQAKADIPDAMVDPVDDPLPDYRPLPPATRSERPQRFQNEPIYTQAPAQTTPTAIIAVVSGLTLAVVLTTLLITNWGTLAALGKPTAVVETPTVAAADQYEAQIAQAKSAVEQNPNDPQLWTVYANLLYDSAQIIRENMPDSTLYQQRIPRWLEASGAYSKVLELEPGNVVALADKGTSLCYYGAGVGDQSFVTEGIKNVREAASARPDDPLIQLNLGNCLISALPPQTSEALEIWQKVLKIAPVDSPIAQRARELIDQYQKKS